MCQEEGLGSHRTSHVEPRGPFPPREMAFFGITGAFSGLELFCQFPVMGVSLSPSQPSAAGLGQGGCSPPALHSTQPCRGSLPLGASRNIPTPQRGREKPGNKQREGKRTITQLRFFKQHLIPASIFKT